MALQDQQKLRSHHLRPTLDKQFTLISSKCTQCQACIRECAFLSSHGSPKNITDIGIVLDCCTKPSHDLGDEEHFNAMFGEMKDYLLSQGIKTVLLACPEWR